MESRILIKNIGRSKGGQTETFSASQFRELTVGRDPSCDIKFDPNDDLVSRRHSKITKVSDAPEYTIADLGSRNGTLVNKKRIFEPTRLNCGDVVQLGPDGPQFEFDLDPRPASMIKPTRLSDAPIGAGTTLAPTRESPSPMAPTRQSPTPTGAPAERAPIGKVTVERMISQTKSQGRKMAYSVTVGLIVVIGAVAGWLYWKQPQPPAPPPHPPPTPAEIAAANTEATVYFEVAWKLIYTKTGKQIYHVLLPNKRRVSCTEDATEQIVPGGDPYLPAFFMNEENQPEPWLATDEKTADKHDNTPIGLRLTGTGFVVSSDGYILTARHVAASWFADYDFPDTSGRYGILIVRDETGKCYKETRIDTSQIRWIPANLKLLTQSSESLATLEHMRKLETTKVVEGRNDVLDVTFAKNRIRIPAKLARTSDRQDVAMVKIDIPQTLKSVELNDNYDMIKVGDPVLTLGYPAVSAQALGVAMSHDIVNQQMTAKIIPDPTLSVGNVGLILRGASGMEQAKIFGGDYYQLTINSTGEGNSGGPVFDGWGKVIAIFTFGIKSDVTVSGAVPIRYAKELMTVKSMEAK